MKVLLVNPPIRTQEPPKHVPYGLSMIASVLDSAGIATAVLDANAYRLGIDEISEIMKEDRFDVIGVTGLVTQYRYVKEIVRVARKVHRDATIILGGGLATSMPFEVMKLLPEVDIVVIGEGEETILELVEEFTSKNWDKVDGIAYREGEKIFLTKPRALIGYGSRVFHSLDDLPYPAWHLFPMEDVYFQNSSLLLSPEASTAKRRIDLITERGCPKNCKFCTHLGMSPRDLTRIYGNLPFIAPPVRYQSARYVVEMVRYARVKYAVDFVAFMDENFTANRKRALEICDLLEKEDLSGVVKWGCLGSVDTVDLELLQRMRESGCTYISFGGETANNDLLMQIGKGTTVEEMQRAIDMCRRVGITPVMTFMEGYPGETLQHVLNTVEFWVRNNVYTRPFFITPYPGTEMFDEYREEILRQWDGDLEEFLMELGDATKLVVNLTGWSDAELLGIRELMVSHDLKRLRRMKNGQG